MKLLWSFVPAIVLVAAGWLALGAGSSWAPLGVILVWPGILAALLLHAWFWEKSGSSSHPFLYDLQIVVAAILGWALIGYLVLSILVPLVKAIRHHRR